MNHYTSPLSVLQKSSQDTYETKKTQLQEELIAERSFIVLLDKEIALLAADVKQEHKLHTIDAIVYATVQHKGLTLITDDQHFANMPNVEMI